MTVEESKALDCGGYYDTSTGVVNPVIAILPNNNLRTIAFILAHELRHVWQWKHDFNPLKASKTLEDDADDYARHFLNKCKKEIDSCQWEIDIYNIECLPVRVGYVGFYGFIAILSFLFVPTLYWVVLLTLALVTIFWLALGGGRKSYSYYYNSNNSYLKKLMKFYSHKDNIIGLFIDLAFAVFLVVCLIIHLDFVDSLLFLVFIGAATSLTIMGILALLQIINKIIELLD